MIALLILLVLGFSGAGYVVYVLLQPEDDGVAAYHRSLQSKYSSSLSKEEIEHFNRIDWR